MALGSKYNKSPLKGNDTYGLLGGTSTYSKYTGNSNKNTSSNTNTIVGPASPKPVLSYTSSATSGGGSGVSTTSITPQNVYDATKDAYEKAYEAAVKAAKDANEQDLKTLSDTLNRTREDIATQRNDLSKIYDTQASNLSKSIERFREQNKENVASQRQAYLSNQAALEAAREQADRQNRISAAARGLGGSGLQQLAQLQNLINQGQDISDLATENQSAMDTLRKALAQAEEDYTERSTNVEETRKSELDKLDTALRRANEDYETKVTNANTNLANLLAQYEASRADSNKDALTTLYSMISNASSGSGGSSASDLSLIIGGLQADQQDFENALSDLNKMTDKQVKNTYGKGVTKEEAAQSLYNKYLASSNDYLRNYGNQYLNQTNISANNLRNILNNYGY